MTELQLGQMRIPDILETIADLSNDEVFTPPDLANKVLDMLPQEIWSNSEITFLDPACKTGVLLREITKRLIVGLENEIPDLQERVNHILTKQVYGLGITELTTLMSRRTVYCATKANSEASVVTAFDNADGNIKFPNSKHVFNEKTKKCTICGAGEDLYHEIENRDNYAYSFLHDNLKEVFGNVKFDVIIGNPPYQLMTGSGGAQATPLYHKFIEKGVEMNPSYISMIVPSRWFTGGMGLGEFREKMLKDKRIQKITHYESSFDVFKNMGVNGGINYFLWNKEYSGDCTIKNINVDGIENETIRPLIHNDLDIFISDNMIFNIIKKVESVCKKEKTKFFDTLVSPACPYGKLNHLVKERQEEDDDFHIYALKKEGFVNSDEVENLSYNHKHKIFISLAYGGNINNKQVINVPFIPKENSICSETYLSIGPFKNELETKNALELMKTKFFRALVWSIKKTQHGTKQVYRFVPILDLKKKWTDEELYKKYNLNEYEIAYIEKSIADMK